MKSLPVADPGTPDDRSATRYLLWLARSQAGTLVVGVLFGVLWMVVPALAPAVVGRAVDALTAHDRAALERWSLLLLGLGVVQAVAGVYRHRFAVTNWLAGAYRTVQVTARHAASLGATLPKRVLAGEVVSIGTADISHLGHAMDITARGGGAVAALVVVTVILLSAAPRLGLVVVCGVPLLLVAVAVLLRPLHRRQQAYRELTAELTGRAADIVTGLRVLRGVGGEALFAARYRAESQRLRASGVRVARVESILEAAQVLLPGCFVALVTWIGARFALAGDITAGDLVAFYGYAAFLIFPLRTLVEFAQRMTRAHVSARRVVRLLRVRPEVADPVRPAPAPAAGGDLVDPGSGLFVRSGLLTALAATDPADAAAIAERLGRYDPASAARLAGVALRDLAVSDVRDRILVAGNDARLFRGRLRDELGTGASAARLAAALHAAAAEDIVDALPAGLDTEVTQGGREFSGGQQQRLRLARALLADPPVLVLVEPTSAVDAHTEARIGDRLAAARVGRTTLVCTTSPLLLDRADRVAFVAGGRVVAEGTHAELLDAQPRYAATVTRGEDS
jgi:ABC-type multidrug transport system fused ATPase/permease subunit